MDHMELVLQELQKINGKLDTLEQQGEKVDSRLDKLEQRQDDVAKSIAVLMDAEFTPKFNLLAENQEIILEKLVPRSRIEELEDEVKFLKSLYRQMNEELQELKKAN